MTYSYQDFLAHLGIGGAHPGGLDITKNVLNKERLKMHHKVLDVGCGTGQTAVFIVKHFGCHVTGLDSHPLMLKKARKRSKRKYLSLPFVLGKVENMPFDDNTFDAVIAESVTLFTNIPLALKEYARVLKPNGVLLNLDMAATHPLSPKETKEFKRVYHIEKIPTATEWLHLFLETGFDHIRIVQKGQVSTSIKQHAQPSADEMDLDPSADIDPKLYDTWQQHAECMKVCQEKLTYHYFRMEKPKESTNL